MANHAHITPLIGPKAFPGLSMHEARLALEAEIEKLISYLDRIDGDSDLEPDADREPALGWPTQSAGCLRCDAGDDREFDDCDLEPNGDDEPLLGWSEEIGGVVS